jgi:alanine dehydrogenase
MTANIARTASRALANAAISYIEALAAKGLEGALRGDPGLAQGVYMYKGAMVNEMTGATLGIPARPLSMLI